MRLPKDLADWLKETSKKTGIPVSEIVREQLETAKQSQDEKPFLRLAGIIEGGPPDVSMRKGFSAK